VNFIREHQLPGNVFNDYNLGGFLDWSLPQHKVYVDSRAIPFGVPLLGRQRTLLAESLDSTDWTREADQRDINLIILSVQRYTGLGKVALDADCKSRNWRPVYLDDVAAVFLRNNASNAELVRELQIDCATAPFPEPQLVANAGYRARANAYNFYANAGAVLYLLGRDRESAHYLDDAAGLYTQDSNLHLTRAELFAADGFLPQAEEEFKESIAQRPTDIAWYLLGVLYGKEHRYPEAAHAMLQSAEISYTPADRYRIVGQIYNAMEEPKEALAAFAQAEEVGSHGSTEDRAIFAAQIASGRARSFQLLGDLNRAIQEQKIAVNGLPQDSGRWEKLAELYRAQGNAAMAASAQAKAESLRASPPENR
jgi:tetratricopeptide (TPR) repeat protein